MKKTRSLPARLSAVERRLDEREREGFIDAELRAGRIGEDELEAIRRAYAAAPEAVAAIVRGRPADPALAAEAARARELADDDEAYAAAASARGLVRDGRRVV